MAADAELLALERKTLKAAAGGWLDAVDELRALLADESPDTRRKLLALVAPTVEAKLIPAVATAFKLGVADATAIVKGVKLGKKAKPSQAATAALVGLDARGREAVAKAQKLARADIDLATALAPVFAHANSLRASTAASINQGGNEGSLAVADAAGVPTVWVAETDACLDCLAYSGRVSDSGDAFPGGLTYGATSYFPDDLETPPLHPNCRCIIEPLVDQSYADALRREADRSVLRGFSLENESMRARIDAADRLLKDGVKAPASVKAYARDAISAGKFPTRGRP